MQMNHPTGVLVIGHLNHDRIWQLDGPLVPGGRLAWTSRSLHLGGGAWFTGSRLLELGHRVALVSDLATDRQGAGSFADLAARGFDMTNIDRSASATRVTEILLDPAGERTILTAGDSFPQFELVAPVAPVEAAYMNIRHIGPTLRAVLERVPLVLAQLPLVEGLRAPADFAVTSQTDFAGLDGAGIMARATACFGPRLRAVIVTDADRPVWILGRDGTRTEVAVTAPLQLKNSIGAGDSFAGCLLHMLLQGRGPAAAVAAANALVRDWLLGRDLDGMEGR